MPGTRVYAISRGTREDFAFVSSRSVHVHTLKEASKRKVRSLPAGRSRRPGAKAGSRGPWPRRNRIKSGIAVCSCPGNRGKGSKDLISAGTNEVPDRGGLVRGSRYFTVLFPPSSLINSL